MDYFNLIESNSCFKNVFFNNFALCLTINVELEIS